MKVGPAEARQAFDTGTAIKSSLRRIETLGKPVVAAINGAALGGGYEIALASHHRIALDAPAPRSACPRSPSVCCRPAAASPAPYASWASPTPC